MPVLISIIGLIYFIYHSKSSHSYKSELAFTAFIILFGVSSSFYFLPNLILEVNNFVYYGESPVSSIVLYRVIGYCLGIMVSFLAGLSIYKIVSKLEGKVLGTIIVFSFAISFIPLFNVVLARLYFLKILPRSSFLFDMIAFISNKEYIFIFVVLVLLSLASIILYKQNTKVHEDYANNAELRKIKYVMKNKRRWALFFTFIGVLSIFSLSGLKSYVNRDIPLSEPEEFVIKDGHIEIPLSELEDNHLHRYEYLSTNGIPVRFIVIKKAQGSYGVGLDACEICGASGYFERDDEVVCKLCDVVMNKGTIGFKGGCNPIPFKYIVHDEKIKIDTKTLDELDHVFK